MSQREYNGGEAGDRRRDRRKDDLPTHHVEDLLDDYIDGSLSVDESSSVERHLDACDACRESLESLRALVASVKSFPGTQHPSRDLWPEIRQRLGVDTDGASATDLETPATDVFQHRTDRRTERGPEPRANLVAMNRRWIVPVAASLLIVGLLLVWITVRTTRPGWDVTSLAGVPALDNASLSGKAKIRAGQWLETDAESRALLDVGNIGRVEVGPDTRLQIRETKGDHHRLALEEGSIDAVIWAPPRLFYVETPSALAIDLGCAYTLAVDSTGTSLLHVTFGYVELERDGRRSLVPAGTMCMARRGVGPGTAFDENASPELVDALKRFDFEDGGSDALDAVIAASGPDDVITLWQLFRQVESDQLSRLYDRLVLFIDPPEGVTKEAVIGGDADAMHEWEYQLGLAVEDYLPVPEPLAIPGAEEDSP